MTLNETRQLGIELERRILITNPNAVLVNKIDTETLYSFLNEYQKLYLRLIYISEDLFKDGTRLSYRTQDILKNLIKCTTLSLLILENIYGVNVYIADLPDDYHNYIRSVSTISGTYKGNVNGKPIQNILVKHQDINKLLQSAYDDYRIMRNTYSTLHLNDEDNPKPKLYIYCDKFTSVDHVDLYYYKNPVEFTILGEPKACELPIECFDDLVNGAYALYMSKMVGKNINLNEQNKKSEQS